MVWKDQLLPGASRIPIPITPGSTTPFGHVTDFFGQPVYRSDWVDAGGQAVISGDSDQAAWMNLGIRPGSNPQNTALAQALATAQGQAEAARARAQAGLAALEPYSRSQGPTIGGNPIDSPAAMPLLAALGQKQETEEERQRRLLLEQGFGVA